MTGLRIAGYGRVSHQGKREELRSPDIQKAQIAREAKTLAYWGCDIDHSGGKMDGPEWQKIMGMARRREIDCIYVAYLSRFSRNLKKGIEALEELRTLGIKFVACDFSYDPNTAAGEMMLNTMLNHLQFELRQKAEAWTHAHEDHLKRGVATRIPIGYVRAADKTALVDPNVGPTITELFRRRAAGANYVELLDWINGLGTHPEGRDWTRSHIHRILRNRFYLGELHYQGYDAALDAHEALVDLDVFFAVQDVNERTTQPRPAAGENRGLLAGLVRCAGCRYKLLHKVSGGRRYYACPCNEKGRTSTGTCAKPARIRADLLEELVMGRLWAHFDGLAVKEVVAHGDDGKARERLARMRKLYDDRKLDLEWALETGHADAKAEQKRLRLAIDELDLKLNPAKRGDLPDPETFFDKPLDFQRNVLAATFDCIFLRGRPRGDIADDVVILGKGEGPTKDELPCPGQSSYVIRPFVFPQDRVVDLGVERVERVAVAS